MIFVFLAFLAKNCPFWCLLSCKLLAWILTGDGFAVVRVDVVAQFVGVDGPRDVAHVL